MFRLLHLLLLSVFLVKFVKCVSVLVENDQKHYMKSFQLPVIDGIQIRDDTLHTLEVQSLEPKDRNNTLKMVANFPNLRNFNVSSFELDHIPKFLNVPLLEFVLLEYNDLTKIQAVSFSELPNLKDIYFTSNIIEEIENDSFGKTVIEVNLDCNLLKEVKKTWFQNPGILEVLSIRNNKISFLDENLLQDFVKLKQANFANNVITNIGDRAFIGANYKILNIQGNQISELKPSIFSASNVTINTFNIGLNRMSFLAQNLLDVLYVERFLIFGNPWQCPCLKKITAWLTKTNVNETVTAKDRVKWEANNPVCIYALSFSHTCIEVVDHELYNTYLESIGPLESKTYC